MASPPTPKIDQLGLLVKVIVCFKYNKIVILFGSKNWESQSHVFSFRDRNNPSAVYIQWIFRRKSWTMNVSSALSGNFSSANCKTGKNYIHVMVLKYCGCINICWLPIFVKCVAKHRLKSGGRIDHAKREVMLEHIR